MKSKDINQNNSTTQNSLIHYQQKFDVFKTFVLLNLMLFTLFLNANPTTQAVSIETPTVVINSNDSIADVSILLNADQLPVNALSFAILYDKDVVTPVNTEIFAGGAFNPLEDGIIRFALFNINSFTTSSVLAEIQFDYIGGGGTASDLNIELFSLYDINNVEITNSVQLIEGSVSKNCFPDPVYGCTNDRYIEYSPLANCDDLSCTNLFCLDANYQKYSEFSNPEFIQSYISDDGTKLLFREAVAWKLLEADNGNWVQNTNDIPTQPNFGYSDYALSGDADRIVFISTDVANQSLKHIETYELNSNVWSKPNSDLIFNTFINNISISKDGSSLIINHPSSQFFQVYEWVNSNWQQKGTNIFGSSPLISADGNAVFYRESSNASFIANFFNGTNWVAKGSSFPNGNYLFADNGNGILKIETSSDPFSRNILSYEWDGASWNQKGDAYLVSGSHIRVSGDFNTIGASNQWNAINLYKFNGNNWYLSNTIDLVENGFIVLDYQLSGTGDAAILRGYSSNDDFIDIFSYYANDCNPVSQTFCTDTYVLDGLIESDTYNSEDKIYSSGLVNVNSNGDVQMESEQFINLKTNFVAYGDVNFEAKIENCNP